jgi:hypothetical protein
MCLQVTRLLVDAVTVSTANTEREHCFLPSHKGSPYHVHKLAERVLPAELLQVSCAVQSQPLSIHTPSSCSEPLGTHVGYLCFVGSKVVQ